MAEQKPKADGKSEVEKRRIVVGLDTSFMGREVLALAARVAHSVNAGLAGIFVEDENLLALSALPFVREISMTGAVGNIDGDTMLRTLQAQAQIARRILERTAQEADISFTFDIARGRRLSALAERSNAADTLIIRAHETSPREVGRAVRLATRDIRADVLLAGRGVAVARAFAGRSARPRMPEMVPPGFMLSTQRPLLAVDEGSSLGEACVGFAESLAERLGAPFRRLFARGFAAADLASAARKAGAGLIVINAAALGDDDDAARLSMAAGCPVLLLGGDGDRNVEKDHPI